MFPHLTETQIAGLRRSGTVRPVRPGDILFKPNDAVVHFFVLLSGGMEILQPSTNGDRRITTHEPKQFTGEMSMISGQRCLVLGRVTNPGDQSRRLSYHRQHGCRAERDFPPCIYPAPPCSDRRRLSGKPLEEPVAWHGPHRDEQPGTIAAGVHGVKGRHFPEKQGERLMRSEIAAWRKTLRYRPRFASE